MKLIRDFGATVYGPIFKVFFEDGTTEVMKGPQETVVQQFYWTSTKRVTKLELSSIRQGGYLQGYDLDELFFRATPAAVPEPASWATMIAGFGLIGGTLRRRVVRQRFAAAA